MGYWLYTPQRTLIIMFSHGCTESRNRCAIKLIDHDIAIFLLFTILLIFYNFLLKNFQQAELNRSCFKLENVMAAFLFLLSFNFLLSSVNH